VQTAALATPTAEKGKIKRIINRISKYFGRYDTVEEVNTPADQTLTLVNSTYAGTTTTVKHTENATDLTTPTLERGKIKRQEASRTQSGNQATIESTEVPSNLTAQAGAADVFAETAQETEKEVTFTDEASLLTKILSILSTVRTIKSVAIPAYLTLNDGESGEMVITDKESGNKEVAIKLETTKTTTSTEVDEKDAFSTKATTETTGATSKSSVSGFTAGTIKTVVNKWMRFKNRYLTTAVTETATARSMLKSGALGATTGNDIIVERSDTGSTQLQRYYNAAYAPTIAASETSGSKTVRIESIGINRLGRHDYAKYIKSHTLPASGSSGSWSTTGGLYWLPFGYNSDGSLYTARQYRRNYTHTLSFHLTLAAAISAVNGGIQGSMPHRIGDYLYVAHKIIEATPTHVGTATFGTAH